jgi:hypothetical protein
MALDDHWNYSTDFHSPMISSNSAAPVFAILRPKEVSVVTDTRLAELISSGSSA